jgi:hypothetical protein
MFSILIGSYNLYVYEVEDRNQNTLLSNKEYKF